MAKKPLGTISNELHLEREEIRELQAAVDKKKKAYRLKEEAALERMEKEGTSKVTGEFATMSISVVTVPQVKDWDKFWGYIKRNSAFHLMERRPSAKAWREEVETRRNRPIPGVEGFQKRSLNLRNI